MTAISVDVGIQEVDTSAAAEVLRLIARQIEEDYREGFDRRDGGYYCYTVTVTDRGASMSVEPELPWSESPVDGSIDCGEGWWPIIAALDRDLRQIVPSYRVDQVKEKFGTLRYYINMGPQDDETRERVYGLLDTATELSARTCEKCGRPGRLRNDRPWIRTLCDQDAERQVSR